MDLKCCMGIMDLMDRMGITNRMGRMDIMDIMGRMGLMHLMDMDRIGLMEFALSFARPLNHHDRPPGNTTACTIVRALVDRRRSDSRTGYHRHHRKVGKPESRQSESRKVERQKVGKVGT